MSKDDLKGDTKTDYIKTVIARFQVRELEYLKRFQHFNKSIQRKRLIVTALPLDVCLMSDGISSHMGCATYDTKQKRFVEIAFPFISLAIPYRGIYNIGAVN